jgi:hypothetical protein
VHLRVEQSHVSGIEQRIESLNITAATTIQNNLSSGTRKSSSPSFFQSIDFWVNFSYSQMNSYKSFQIFVNLSKKRTTTNKQYLTHKNCVLFLSSHILAMMVRAAGSHGSRSQEPSRKFFASSRQYFTPTPRTVTVSPVWVQHHRNRFHAKYLHTSHILSPIPLSGRKRASFSGSGSGSSSSFERSLNELQSPKEKALIDKKVNEQLQVGEIAK